MSTAIQGLVINQHGHIPVGGATVVAVSTDGYTEGSATTDANGHFSLTGLSNKNWLAKVTSEPKGLQSGAHVVVLLPNNVDHQDLSSVLGDDHHAGFIGLYDNAGDPVEPDTDDRIQFTDDGIINIDIPDETEGKLAFSIAQGQIDHGSLGGIVDDDHSRYADLGGRAGGQELHGGTEDDEDFTIKGTSAATPGSVYIQSSGDFEYDPITGELKLPTTGAAAGLLVGGDARWYRNAANEWRTPDAVIIDGTLAPSGTTHLWVSKTYNYVFHEETLLSGIDWNGQSPIQIHSSGERGLIVPKAVRVTLGSPGVGNGGGSFCRIQFQKSTTLGGARTALATVSMPAGSTIGSSATFTDGSFADDLYLWTRSIETHGTPAGLLQLQVEAIERVFVGTV